MSDHPINPDWWQASDGKWYAPELHPSSAEAAPVVPSPAAGSPESPPKQRKRWLVGGVAAIAAVGVVAVGLSALQGVDGTGSGYGSPEAAVSAFVASMDDEDPIGLASTMDPDDLGDMAEALQSLADDGDGVAGLPGGVELEVSIGNADQLRTTPLGDTGDLMLVEIDSLTATLRRTDEPPAA